MSISLFRVYTVENEILLCVYVAAFSESEIYEDLHLGRITSVELIDEDQLRSLTCVLKDGSTLPLYDRMRSIISESAHCPTPYIIFCMSLGASGGLLSSGDDGLIRLRSEIELHNQIESAIHE